MARRFKGRVVVRSGCGAGSLRSPAPQPERNYRRDDALTPGGALGRFGRRKGGKREALWGRFGGARAALFSTRPPKLETINL